MQLPEKVQRSRSLPFRYQRVREAVKLHERPLHQQHGLVPLRVPKRLRAGWRKEMPRSAFCQSPRRYSNSLTRETEPAFRASKSNLLNVHFLEDDDTFWDSPASVLLTDIWKVFFFCSAHLEKESF